MGINAFTRGCAASTRRAEVKVIWTNSWYDPGREREAADTLISQGADAVTHHTDSTATVQAAEAKKVYAIGYHCRHVEIRTECASDGGHAPVGARITQGRAGCDNRYVEAHTAWGGIRRA
jgi:hypothetical protein